MPRCHDIIGTATRSAKLAATDARRSVASCFILASAQQTPSTSHDDMSWRLAYRRMIVVDTMTNQLITIKAPPKAEASTTICGIREMAKTARHEMRQ